MFNWLSCISLISTLLLYPSVLGSYTVSQLILDASAFTVTKCYQYSFTLAAFVSETSSLLYHWSCVTISTTIDVVTASTLYVYNTTYWLSTTLYQWLLVSCETFVVTTLSAVQFISYWSYTIVTVGSRSLYVAFNQYGLHYGYILVTHIVDWILMMATILIKFFTDLAVYFWRFISVATNQIYTVLYIVFGFCYQIISAVLSIIRFWIDGMVFLVTIVFSGVIWFLEKTIFAYTSAMMTYNRYREILFLGVCALIVVYCGGVIKDRRTRRSGDGDGVDGAEESSTDEEEEEFIRETISVMDMQNNQVAISRIPL